jgi:hypothetical protein
MMNERPPGDTERSCYQGLLHVLDIWLFVTWAPAQNVGMWGRGVVGERAFADTPLRPYVVPQA